MEDNKTTKHVLICKGANTDEVWMQELTKLEEWMKDNKIHSELRETILHYVQAWRENVQPHYLPSNLTLRTAIREQHDIGWFQFVKGIWSQNFLQTQQDYMHQQNSMKSPQLLMSKLQRRIWHIACPFIPQK